MYPYDVDKAKSLMSEAGVSKPTLKVLYRNESNGSTKTFETLQEDLGKVGIKVKGVPASNADFYTKYLQDPDEGPCRVPSTSRSPDGDRTGTATPRCPTSRRCSTVRRRSRRTGPTSGCTTTRRPAQLIDQAAHGSGRRVGRAVGRGRQAVMEDAAFYPITSPKTANYHAKHLHNAVPMDAFQNYDPANVWIEKAYQD